MGFKQSVIDALAYYVYALVDPRDNRIFASESRLADYLSFSKK